MLSEREKTNGLTKCQFLHRDKLTYYFYFVGYGLALPFSDHDTIKDCVNIYCEWLSALLPEPKASVPLPIAQDPNLYARKIVQHLYHLFVPRPGDGSEMIHRQAVLCHRVLRRIQDIVKQSSVMLTETWESFLGEELVWKSLYCTYIIKGLCLNF